MRIRYEKSAAKKTDEPAPPAARKTTSHPNVGARAAAADDALNTSAPVEAIARSPNRSTARPATRSKASRVSANEEVRTPTSS